MGCQQILYWLWFLRCGHMELDLLELTGTFHLGFVIPCLEFIQWTCLKRERWWSSGATEVSLEIKASKQTFRVLYSGLHGETWRRQCDMVEKQVPESWVNPALILTLPLTNGGRECRWLAELWFPEIQPGSYNDDITGWIHRLRSQCCLWHGTDI